MRGLQCICMLICKKFILSLYMHVDMQKKIILSLYMHVIGKKLILSLYMHVIGKKMILSLYMHVIGKKIMLSLHMHVIGKKFMLSLSHPSLGWLYVFSSFPPRPQPQQLLPLMSKAFELNLRYLAQRIDGSGEMYSMTFPWPWPKVTAEASISKNLLVCTVK